MAIPGELLGLPWGAEIGRNMAGLVPVAKGLALAGLNGLGAGANKGLAGKRNGPEISPL